MIDQEKQSIFSGELSHYIVTLAMREKQLEIKVSDKENLHKLHGFISQQFINSQDRFFCAYFECPEDVFTHITEHFQETVIENGILRFHYTSGKKSQVRDVVVELVKEEADDNALAHLKIAKMKDHFAAQLKQRDGQIAALSKEIREIANKFEDYKRESQDKMGMMEEKIQTQQNRIQKQEIHAKALEDRLQTQEKNIKDMEERLQREEKSGKDKEERIQRNENIMMNSIPQPISHHRQNTHQQYYYLTNSTATSAKLTRVAGGSGLWQNFVNRTEVLPKQRNKYAVRMLKITKSCLYIGFCTEKGLGNINNYGHAESAYYYCNGNGYLFQGGTQKNLSGCSSVEGELVESVLDFFEWRVRWSKGGNVFAECAVPTAMKGKPIYFSVLLHYGGDAIEAISI